MTDTLRLAGSLIAGRTLDLPVASLSVSGTLPAPANDVHDFLVEGFAAGTIIALRASLRTPPAVDTTFRVMRNGAPVGTVTIAAGLTEGLTSGLSVACALGDNFTLDVTAGDGSGANALVRAIATVAVRTA